MKPHTKLGWIIVLFLILINTGCIPIISTEFSANVGMGEKWSLEITIIPMPGYENDLISQLNEKYVGNQDFLSLGIQSQVEALQPLPDESTPIKISFKGTGYDSFNFVLNEQAITPAESDGRRILYFDSSALNQITSNSSTFTLSGGTIIAHNGTLVNDHTVTWNNPTDRMQATMAEPTLLDYWLYIAIAAILCMLVVFVVLLAVGLAMSSKSKKAKKIRAPRVKACTQCGSPIPVVAVFCPNCGSQQN